MKIDDVLTAHKLCWTPGEALDDPVCCDGCPYKQYGDACARHLIADTIEVLEDCKNNSYELVHDDLLMDDARNFVRDYLADKQGCYPDDIDDDELEKYDYIFLIERYECYEDANVAYNDTWKSVVADYMADLEEDYDDDDDEED